MKKIAAILITCWATFQLGAAEGNWLTDFEKAKETAKSEGKMILMDFTGSDWCPPCKALHKNVLTSKEFVEYAKDHLILVEVDFPRQKKQSEGLKKANRELAAKFDIEGYPTIIVLDSTGRQLSKKVGYGGAKPKAYVDDIKALKK